MLRQILIVGLSVLRKDKSIPKRNLWNVYAGSLKCYSQNKYCYID